MKQLREALSFGAVDADNDDLLLRSFEDHQAYRSVLQQERFLVLGKKGSGKTAIFKKLLDVDRPDFFCFGHTFSDYPWHHHDLQARTGIPDFDKYTHSWKYLILLTAAKIILNYDNSLPYDDASLDHLSRIERFVVDSYGSRDPDVSQLFSPTKQLKLRPNFEIDWKVLKVGISPEQVPISELPVIVQEVNANLLRSVIGALNPQHEYFICFDQLDLGFDPTNDNYVNRLIGLILACRDLNLAARAQRKRFFVVVLLRDDIYDALRFEDKNKITENFVSLIEWDTPRTRNTLKELMENRFRAVLGDSPGESVLWGQVFNETREMPGHQTKYQHMLDHTYQRPRDMIKFCNLVLDNYRDRLGKGFAGADAQEMIDNIDIHNAKQAYSDYFVRELDDEIHKHLPNYGKYLEALRAIGTWHFATTDFITCCEQRSLAHAGEVPDILAVLYRFSIIGFYRPGGKGYGGSEYVFRYKEPRTGFDPTAERFRVHPGLIEHLGLKRK